MDESPEVLGAVNEARDKIVGYLSLVREELGRALPAVLRRLYGLFGNIPAEGDIEKHILPIYGAVLHETIHELAHSMLERLPAMARLREEDYRRYVLASEILARFIERDISKELREIHGLATALVEDFGQQLEELKHYPELGSLRMEADEYRELYEQFWREVGEGRSVNEVAADILEKLEEHL